MVTKLEINLRSLLASCEELVKDESNFWRIKNFIKSLDEMLFQLSEYENAQTMSSISDYIARLRKLKVATNYIGDSAEETKPLYNNIKDDSGDGAIREVRQLLNYRTYADLRKELIDDGHQGFRQRKFNEQDDQNEVVKYHINAQEKITQHMLSLTKNLKEQTLTANRIIKRDTEIVSKSSAMTDKNLNSLSKENTKLQEHSKRAWKCWTFLMFGTVIFIFITMVLFMKIVKKT